MGCIPDANYLGRGHEIYICLNACTVLSYMHTLLFNFKAAVLRRKVNIKFLLAAFKDSS
jgi:hypothetical protein